MSFPLSEGNWKVGNHQSCVVTDCTPSWYKGNSGHEDMEYYGGFLIAESIASEADAKLIAAAKDMEHALRSFIAGMNNKDEKFPGHNQAYLSQVVLPRAIEALKKAGIYE